MITYAIVGALMFAVFVLCRVADRQQPIPVKDEQRTLDVSALPLALKRSGWKGDFWTKRGM